MSSAEVQVLSRRCTKLRKELTSLHESFRKSKLKTKQQDKELDELSDLNNLLRSKVKAHEGEIRRLKKFAAKTRVWKKKAKARSDVVKTLKGDVEFLEKTLERDTCENLKYRKLADKRLGEIAKEREDARDMLFKEKILNDCADIEKEEMITKLRALTAMNEELTSRNELLQQETLDLHVKIDDMEKAHFEEINGLASSLDKEKHWGRQLSRNHEDVLQEKEYEMKTLENELDGAEMKLDLLRQTSISHETCIEKLVEKNERIEGEKKELNQKLEAMRTQKEFYEDEACVAKMELDAETSRVKEMQEKLEDKKVVLNKIHIQAKTDSESLRGEVLKLRDQLRKVHLQYGELEFKYHAVEKKVFRTDAVNNGLQMQNLTKDRAHSKEINEIFSEVNRVLMTVGELTPFVDMIEPTAQGICVALKKIRARAQTLQESIGDLTRKEKQRDFDLKSAEKKLAKSRCIQRIQHNLDLALKETETSFARDRLKSALHHDRLEEIILKREVADLERKKTEMERDLGLLHI